MNLTKKTTMQLLKGYKYLKGSSIVESVIAIAIISVCVLIAVLVFANVGSSNNSLAYYKAANDVEKIFNESIDNKDFNNELFKHKNYSVEKKVLDIGNSDEGLKEFTFTITISERKFIEKRLVYSNE